jgi:hypothetical protein
MSNTKQGKLEYTSPLIVDLGDVTKMTLGCPVASMDSNYCPGPCLDQTDV